MPVELKKSTLRIRVKDPKLFKVFRTDDIGTEGKLKRIAGYTGKDWLTQAYLLQLNDYNSFAQAKKDINQLRIPITKKAKAIKLAKKYYGT